METLHPHAIVWLVVKTRHAFQRAGHRRSIAKNFTRLVPYEKKTTIDDVKLNEIFPITEL
jgi:hypothetical protein